MALTPYTTNADVRGLLGVSDEELADSVLELTVYSQGLLRELRKVDSGLPALFTTINDKLPSDRTDYESAVLEATSFFAAHAVALQAGTPLGLMAPKRITDDKAGFERFSDSPYRDVLSRLEQRFAGARQALIDALAALNGTTVAAGVLGFTYAVASQRSYDPVTGE